MLLWHLKSMIKVLTKEEDFYSLIKEKSIIVDFYAEWCSPCKMLLPVLDEIDFCDILKVDVDKFDDLTRKMGVMSVPTLIFFKDGLEFEREIGYRTIDEIKETYNSIK